jgi:DNA polymerase V
MVQGGPRTGAGRPRNSGKYGEATQAVRIPKRYVDQVFHCVQHNFYRLPLYAQAVAAGFPSPAEDDLEERLDLNEMLIKHPAATFFLRVAGVSMIKAGIHSGDILVVDRSLQPVHGRVVIAAVNGELTVKRLSIEGKRVRLVAENEAYPPIDITEEMDLRIWGVVTSVIHAL